MSQASECVRLKASSNTKFHYYLQYLLHTFSVSRQVRILFKNPEDKPVEVVHNLKLDKTFTGLQTLGKETLVDVFLYKTSGGT